jgi:hypothetical protein
MTPSQNTNKVWGGGGAPIRVPAPELLECSYPERNCPLVLVFRYGPYIFLGLGFPRFLWHNLQVVCHLCLSYVLQICLAEL